MATTTTTTTNTQEGVIKAGTSAVASINRTMKEIVKQKHETALANNEKRMTSLEKVILAPFEDEEGWIDKNAIRKQTQATKQYTKVEENTKARHLDFAKSNRILDLVFSPTGRLQNALNKHYTRTLNGVKHNYPSRSSSHNEGERPAKRQKTS